MQLQIYQSENVSDQIMAVPNKKQAHPSDRYYSRYYKMYYLIALRRGKQVIAEICILPTFAVGVALTF